MELDFRTFVRGSFQTVIIAIPADYSYSIASQIKRTYCYPLPAVISILLITSKWGAKPNRAKRSQSGKRNVSGGQTHGARARSEASSQFATRWLHGVYASKVSYGVTSEADEPSQPASRGSEYANPRSTCTQPRARGIVLSARTRTSPYRRPKNLSVEAGNAIEVITSLITTLHAIRDREFVFHERTASTVHPFPVLSSPTFVCAHTRVHTCAGSRAFAWPNNVRDRAASYLSINKHA